MLRIARKPSKFLLAGEEGFEPSHGGIKIRCLDQLGDSPVAPFKLNIKLQFLAGEEGFEPSHGGIKIRCLDQLGDSPVAPFKLNINCKSWRGRKDSNPRMAESESAALANLATPLQMLLKLVGAEGFEPSTNGLKVRCSTAELHSRKTIPFPQILHIWT